MGRVLMRMCLRCDRSNGQLLAQTPLWRLQPKMSAAQREACVQAGRSTANPTYACNGGFTVSTSLRSEA
jgi:hypothetical protein